MKRNYTGLLAFFLLTVMTGCRSSLDLSALIDRDSPLTISTREINPETGLSSSEDDIIKFDSEMFLKLMEFAQNNRKGWQVNHKIYLGTVQVRQDDFKLIFESGYNGVVVSYLDSANKWEQYSKKVKEGELDFLTDTNVSTGAEEEITISGIAENAKWGAIIISDSTMYYMDGLDAWEDKVIGNRVEVTGELKIEKFTAEDLQNEKGEWSQGILGEKRTLLKVSWEVVEK